MGNDDENGVIFLLWGCQQGFPSPWAVPQMRFPLARGRNSLKPEGDGDSTWPSIGSTALTLAATAVRTNHIDLPWPDTKPNKVSYRR